MATETFLTHWVLTDLILPWILVFVLVFAILEKTQLLGEGKKQVNAIIGAVLGLTLLSFPGSREIVVGLIPFLVIATVIIFIFLLLYGFVSGDTKGSPLSKGAKTAIGIGIALALAVTVLIVTNTWDKFLNYLSSSNTGANIIFIIIAAAAVIVVLTGKSKKKED